MKNKKVLISFGILLLIVTGGVYLWASRKNDDTTTQKKPIMTTDRGQNIDMSPGTEEDNQAINSKKVPGGMDHVPVTSETVQISITRASQDANKTLQVRSLLSGLTGGSCKLILTQDGMTIEKTAAVSLQNTGYICDGFDIAVSEFSGKAGTWTATLSVLTTDNKTKSIQQSIIIKL